MRDFLNKACRRLKDDQAGSVLIEALISGVLLVIVSVGVLGGFETANRSSSEERHRARAHSIAQEDLARLRSMSIADLGAMQTEIRNVQVEGTVYVVTSKREFLTDATGTASCTPGTSSADYIRVSSTVTWPTRGTRPPVVATSLVAPPAGSIAPNSGALAIQVQNAAGVATPNIGVAGSGAGSFSGNTGPTGCVIFGSLPEGNYTVNLTGIGSGLVDNDGNNPSPRTTSVVAEATNTLVLQYDNPGTLPVTFKVRNGSASTFFTSSSGDVRARQDRAVLFHTGMTTSRYFGTINTFVNQINATQLFPFTSPYSVYAGSCTGNNPGAGAGLLSALVPSGGSAPITEVQVPALTTVVRTGTSSSSPGVLASNVVVKLNSDTCTDPDRIYNGTLTNHGVPWGVYDICAQGTVSGSTRRITVSNVTVQNLANVTTAPTHYLGSGSGSSSGGCP